MSAFPHESLHSVLLCSELPSNPWKIFKYLMKGRTLNLLNFSFVYSVIKKSPMNNCSWPYYAQPSFIIRFDTLGQVIEIFSGFFQINLFFMS